MSHEQADHSKQEQLVMATLCDVEELEELRKREKEKGITPDWELDAFMKADIRKGKKESIITDLVIKMLGLDVSSLFTVWLIQLCAVL